MKAGKLLRNLYIKFDGNPDLKDSTLLYIPQKLKALNINEIQGDIVLDTSEFDDNPLPSRLDH
ncbi:MAG: D-alanyl-D-alanine carboxypeptidase [Candidatus Midichloria sp.]|nr:MAG: D-alanyl-D-alanine carboxypeptidase [Candidatus Midichloria sp.]